MTSMGLENIQYNLVVKMAVQEGQGRQVRGIGAVQMTNCFISSTILIMPKVALEAKTMEREVETLMGMMPRIRNMLTESDAHEVVLFNLLVSMSSPTGSGGNWRARDDLRSIQHQQRWRPRCLGLSCNGLAGFLLRSHHCRRRHHFHPHYCHHCVSFILMNKTVTNSQRPSLGPGLSLPTLIATVETLARYFHRRARS